MNPLIIKTKWEIEYERNTFSQDCMVVIKEAGCDVCALVTVCLSCDSSDGEYGRRNVCKKCIEDGFVAYDKQQ